MSLILIIFGLFVFWKLPVRELPNGIQPPVVQIQVDYKSASASIVDQEVTQVVEDVIGGAEGIKNIDSKSENGRSTINIEFDTSIDLDNAANDIRERVARIVDNLPSESDPPQILKRAAGFTTTMWLSLSSSTWSDLELGDYAERYLVDQFSSVKNVGRIRVGGLRELSIRVWIDPIRLAANDLTIKEVETAMRGENISLPAGTLEADNIDLTLNLDKSYNDINITGSGGQNVKIQIPARVSLLFNQPNSIGSILGFKNVGESFAVTPYLNIISNFTDYVEPIIFDEIGNKNPSNSLINLNGNNYYMLLYLNDFEGVVNDKDFDNSFNKILLMGNPGDIMFNTFVNSPLEFDIPVSSLEQLKVKFVFPDGSVPDFRNFDHSFTLRIVEMIIKPNKARINPNKTSYEDSLIQIYNK